MCGRGRRAAPCAVMADRLTPLDASFLHTETASAHMHVAWQGRFRPIPARPPITLARVQAQVASRLGLGPALPPAPGLPAGGLRPSRVGRRGALRRAPAHRRARGTTTSRCRSARFDALSDAALSRRLDRTHPLWEIHLAPRLEDGTVGLADEDPPRARRREVRAGRRAAAARRRPGRARAARAARHGLGRAAGPARRGSRSTRSWTPAPSRCARSAARRAPPDRPLA